MTPSLNQGRYIEETIRSVLLQGYPDLEYIVIDGGSTDGSVSVIKRYARWLTFWCSERDSGQPEAINKGLRRSTGDVWTYLNSDDRHEKGALKAVGKAFSDPTEPAWICGECNIIDEDSGITKVESPRMPSGLEDWIPRDQSFTFPQPAVFLRASLRRQVGPFREDLHYCFDYEYWLRILARRVRPVKIAVPLAAFRNHVESKTCSAESGFGREDRRIAAEWHPRVSAETQRRIDRSFLQARATRTVARCWDIVERAGKASASRVLLEEVLRQPNLLRFRSVWGAFRRFYGVG